MALRRRYRAPGSRSVEVDRIDNSSGTNSLMSIASEPASSSALISSGSKMTYWSLANSISLHHLRAVDHLAVRAQTYCCLRREPSLRCRRLKEMRSDETVAEYSRTGIATSPKEIVNDAIERASVAMASPLMCRLIMWPKLRAGKAISIQHGARRAAGRLLSIMTPL